MIFSIKYDDITLATIAETTSVSRPTMYRYYEKKELVFIDLLVQEYVEFEQELQTFLKRKLARETNRYLIVFRAEKKPVLQV